MDNGKFVENISEGRFSVIDMGKDCLYQENGFEYPQGICENKVLYKDVIVDKCRREKGLINLRATVLPKLKTERIFKFPLTTLLLSQLNKLLFLHRSSASFSVCV